MRERRRGRRYFYLALAIGLPIAFDLGFFAARLLPEPKSPAEVGAVDLVVVLTGGQGRLREALQFLSSGKGKYLFISGTEPGATLSDILKANHIDAPGEELRQRILLGDASRSTHENAVEIRRFLQKVNAHTVLLVTSNYHMRRAMELLKEEFSEPPPVPAYVVGYPVESPNFAPGSWWRTFTGWQILISEYVKSWALRF